MPIVSVWVMPAGLLALIVMPFGFDGPLWRVMGAGIEWMNAIALWVASLPGAVGRIAAFEIGAVVVATAGLCVICLLRTWLRFTGVALVLLAILMAARAPRPDVLVSANAEAVAVRGPSGRLSILRSSSETLAARDWLSADGEAGQANDPTLTNGFDCDEAAWVSRWVMGAIVTLARTAHGLVEHCRHADLVVTPRKPPPYCLANVMDRRVLREGGGVAIENTGKGWRIARAIPPGTDRPWAHAQ